MPRLLSIAATVGLLVLVSTAPLAQGAELSGKISIDGSSTVFPLTEAVVEQFMKEHPRVRITVGVSGTGGGFKKFARGEIDFCNASRPMKKSEADDCRMNGIRYMGLPVAVDALSVIVNLDNSWATEMTVAELRRIWEPDAQGKVMNWSHVREGWPNEPIKLFGAGNDSGTFDYFTETINGKSAASRTDYTATEDDHVTIKGVMSSRYSLGYLGYSYYSNQRSEVRAVAIQGKGKAEFVAPSSETVLGGTYVPLSRPIFIYTNDTALTRPEAARFIRSYLRTMNRFSDRIGFVQLPERVVAAGLRRFDEREFSDSDIFTEQKPDQN